MNYDIIQIIQKFRSTIKLVVLGFPHPFIRETIS